MVAEKLHTDELHMSKALSLAARGLGHTSPNPMVGAIVVKNGRIIGEGFHHQAGEPHAEVHAIHAAGAEAKGADLYVTLEPCSHYGRTPPCAELIIQAGLKRVIVGMVDPNPVVAGRGITMLRNAGIEVVTGVLQRECEILNEQFITYMNRERPFITLKSAMSLDGKIATYGGDSQWITGGEARMDGHFLRATHDCILTGVGTVLADNPTLTCRLPYPSLDSYLQSLEIHNDKGRKEPSAPSEYATPFRQPTVVILDALGRTPTDSKILQDKNHQCLLFVSAECPQTRRLALQAEGAEVCEVPTNRHGLDLEAIMKELYKRQYLSVLVEGGSRIIASFVEQKLVDKIVTYVGNIVIGGTEATPAVGGQGALTLKEALPLQFSNIRTLGNSLKIEAYVAR